jgi:PHYB activation tagged suppressor 1
MVGAMVKCASSMADEWEMRVQHDGGCVELEVGDYMRHVTADIIAHTAFGSSYEKGRKVFDQQLVLGNHLGQRAVQRFSALPGYRLLLSFTHCLLNPFCSQVI